MLKRKKILFVSLMFLMGLFIGKKDVNANENKVSVELNIQQLFENNLVNKNSEYLKGDYLLEALDSNNPMPTGSQESKYVFSLKGEKANQSIRFDFEKVGIYKYQIKQTSTKKDNYQYDQSVYSIDIYVLNDVNNGFKTQVIVLNQDGTKKSDIQFKNVYTNKKIKDLNQRNESIKRNKVKTGDEVNYILWIGLAIISLTIITLNVYKKE